MLTWGKFYTVKSEEKTWFFPLTAFQNDLVSLYPLNITVPVINCNWFTTLLSSKSTFLALLSDSRSGPYNTSLWPAGTMPGFINIEQWRDTTRSLHTFWYAFLHWCNCQLNIVCEAKWPSPQKPDQTSSGLLTFWGKFLHHQSNFRQRLALVFHHSTANFSPPACFLQSTGGPLLSSHPIFRSKSFLKSTGPWWKGS